MNRSIVAIVGILSFAASANATWGLRYQVRLNDADPWTNGFFLGGPGQVIKFRVGAYFTPDTKITVADGTGLAAAMNRFTGQFQWTGMLPGDVIQNPCVLQVPNGNAALTQVSGNKIGGTGITSFGSQLFLDALPDPAQTYREILRGQLTLGNAIHNTMTFKTSQFGAGNTPGLTFYTYASSVNKQSGVPDASSGSRIDEEATIFIPCPNAFALAGFAGPLAARRRRD